MWARACRLCAVYSQVGKVLQEQLKGKSLSTEIKMQVDGVEQQLQRNSSVGGGGGGIGSGLGLGADEHDLHEETVDDIGQVCTRAHAPRVPVEHARAPRVVPRHSCLIRRECRV